MKKIGRRNRNKSLYGKNTGNKWRIYISALVISLLFIGIGYKAFTLQVINRDKPLKFAQKQHYGSFTLPARRGDILDRNNTYLATSIETDSVYIRPRQIQKPKKFARQVSQNTNLKYDAVLNLCLSNRPSAWLSRLADEDTINQLKKLNIEGVGFLKEPKRVYPNGHLLGQVLGFTDIDSKGIEGIEYYMDSVLAGNPLKIQFKKDAKRRQILNKPVNIDSTSGSEIQLTIDSKIQNIVENELKNGIIKNGAESGMAVAMDPNTGQILAMASYPFFNPNRFTEFPEQFIRNSPIWHLFEPGSTLKIFLVAAAIEEGVAESHSTYHCENGKRKIGSKIIRDIRPHDTLTVSETVQVSSNICASKIGEKLGKINFYNYLKDFGFGKKLDVDLPGESTGILLSSSKWGPIELATISFGQGIAVTSLQLASALSAIANGGYLMKPYIVNNVISPDGTIFEQKKPEVLKKVISYDTAIELSSILYSVVENGTGKKARIKGYKVAGKTGTAQIPDLKLGGYHKNKYNSSFIGFAPVYDPEITLVIVVNNPKKSIHGGSVAAPIFRAILEKTLLYLGVPTNNDFIGSKLMPDLTGKSKREILRWAENTGVNVKFKGSGFAVNQFPKVGKLIGDNTVCSLELKQDI